MNKEVQRVFFIGDSWVYYKIYSGSKILDSVLSNTIKPLTGKLLNENIIDKWFFIRYADPKQHIRLRFHVTSEQNLGPLISTFYHYTKKLVEEDLVWKVQIETYKREIERYGSNSMVLSENLFYHDSKMILDFLDLIEGVEGVEGDEIRWLFGLKAIDSHLETFEYSYESKQNLLNNLKISYRNRYDSDNGLVGQLSKKYRNERGKIEDFLDNLNHNNKDLIILDEILKAKNESVQSIVQEILALNQNDNLSVNFDALNASFIHMLMNRLFRSKNNLNEMVCYDFLHRYNVSKHAKQKNKISR